MDLGAEFSVYEHLTSHPKVTYIINRAYIPATISSILPFPIDKITTLKLQALKWELVDMGSLNGTFLNSQSVNHPDVGSRRWSEPAELEDGDIITLGSSSKVSVSLTVFYVICRMNNL
jgi:pSer/pThr/pTyr-binding forkhead associated (FHA) protein